MNDTIRTAIESGKAVLGIELGSTRIKAVLIDEAHNPIASGNHDWENKLENNIWTYSMEDVWTGVAHAYAELKAAVKAEYGVTLKRFAAIGFSAMMHGYLPFDKDGNQLAGFRTWRNTITGAAAAELTELFDFNIPQRWSIAHLRQAMLNGEDHVPQIDFITTLAGYIHWKLTGKKVMGVGEASGMFPIDSTTNDYDASMVAKFNALIAKDNVAWKLPDILPEVLVAGAPAGELTAEGAKLLDVEGDLEAGIPMCPPEGDAGTGMVATNSVAVRTGNTSAGTSVFAMIVLEKALKKVHEEIDMVTTPAGMPVAMVHCNNCTSDLNAWVGLFDEYAKMIGVKQTPDELYGALYRKALEADEDCGGLLAYNYFSGEHITGMNEGRPLFVRTPDSRFTLANFMRTNLFAALSVLKIGLNILINEEQVTIDRMFGHGGLFKTKGVGQRIMAAAIQAPVSVMSTAGEGGAWGIALLAAYMQNKEAGETLDHYLSAKVFGGNCGETVEPDDETVAA
ncbi:MAG: FGGY-family carbohydrate kinase, partial [Clostridia bacterium]|nr:FGGY-family carbohydrate kinase [Clostridia bacterium]